MTSGEAIQAIGRDGAVRAKRWLESTTRVLNVWMNPEDEAKLTFSWATKGTFSFDLGGTLYGAELHNKNFFAEVKKYKGPGDQPTEYRKYLAKCYRALVETPSMCDHFMWITWAPFSVTAWSKLMTADYVKDSVLKHRLATLGSKTADPDPALCTAVAERLWLIVLSDKQETLGLSDSERGEILKFRVSSGAP
jgi:hypothetical protein